MTASESVINKIKSISDELQTSQTLTDEHNLKLKNALCEIPHTLNLQEFQEIRKYSLTLWNVAVRLSSSETTPDIKERISSLRSISCEILSSAYKSYKIPIPEVSLCLGRIFSKAGHSWDESGDSKRAEQSFAEAIGSLQSKSLEIDLWRPQKLFVTSSLFVWKAAAAWRLRNREETLVCITKANDLFWEANSIAKSLGSDAEDAADSISDACLAISVDLFSEKAFSEASSLLKFAIELQHKVVNDPQQLQKALRLLASCDIELGKHDEALSILSASTEDTSPETLFVLFRLHLLKERFEEAKSTATRIIEHKSLRVETGIAVCTLFAEKEQRSLAVLCYKELLARYGSDPVSWSTVVLHWVEYILSSAEHDDPAVSSILDEALGRSAGAAPTMLTPTANEELRSSLWDTAVSAFQKKNYRSSLEWFRRALPFFAATGDDALDRAKCLRMIAQCSLSLGENGAAVESAGLALELEPSSLCGQALLFRSRLLRGDPEDEDLAASTLRDIVTNAGAGSVKQKQEYLELCAQCAMELGKDRVALDALEAVIALRCPTSASACTSDNNDPTEMCVEDEEESGIDKGNCTKECKLSWILRSYIKLAQERKDKSTDSSSYSKCCDIVGMCMEQLGKIGPVEFFGNFSEEHGAEEASWLFSACWNMGRDAALAKEYSVASRFYDHSHSLSKILPAADPSASPETRRMCCILSAAAGLETGDQAFARRALVSVAAAKETLFPSLAARKTTDKCVPLLYLLEFQASVVLGCDKDALTRIITDAGMSGALEFGMFESMADYCGPEQQDIACIALKQALSILLLPTSSSPMTSSASIPATTKRETMFLHGTKVSRILRKLIESQNRAGKVGKRRDETFCHYETALRVLSAASAAGSGGGGGGGVWPDDEVEWLMATSWNNGVFFYRATDFAKAEAWMSLSMSFSKHLKGKKTNELMEKAYNEVLMKLRE